MKEQLIFDEAAYKGDKEDIDAIGEAIKKLSSASEKQFQEIKKEKWYNRVFDMITYSQKGKKRLAEQIGTVAQAQSILMELILRLNIDDSNISSLVNENKNNILRMAENDKYLLECVKRIENKALGIKPDMDIRKLSNKEKKILSGCIYKINETNNNPSEAQQAYANALLNYIDTDVQVENPTAEMDRMDQETKRKILTGCMEYIFLNDCTEDAYDKYDSFIEEFDIGNKTIKAIKEQIRALYDLRGYEGFYSKYTPVNYEDIEDYFFVDIDMDDDAMSEEDDVEMTEVSIESILHILPGEIKTYKNNIIHISAYINCEGTLELDHCILYYNETDAGDEITLSGNASLVIRDSQVICKGLDENYFISGTGSNVLFENDTFVNCSYFLKMESDFLMQKCEIKNPYASFIRIVTSKICEISNNKIILDDVSEFYKKNQRISSYMIELFDPAQFYNNIVEENTSFGKVLDDLDMDMTYLSGKIEIKNCSFSGISGVLEAESIQGCTFVGLNSRIYANQVQECRFENCKECIGAGSFLIYNGNAEVDNCIFENCKNVIRVRKGKVKNCQFSSCSDVIISAQNISVEFCEFYNISDSIDREYGDEIFSRLMQDRYGSANIFLERYDNKDRVNIIRKCLFKGINMNQKFFIKGKCYSKLSGPVARIEDCTFMNCSTKRDDGKLYNETDSYYTVFNKEKEIQAIITDNCKGLDKVKKEEAICEAVELRKTSTYGNVIGAMVSVGSVGLYKSLF